MIKCWLITTEPNDSTTTSGIQAKQNLSCMSKELLYQPVGYTVISVILIPVCTKNITVSYVTNGKTRKTFATFLDSTSTPNLRKFVNKAHNKQTNSHSILATSRIEFESHRKYITFSINKIKVHLQFGTPSGITLILQSTSKW